MSEFCPLRDEVVHRAVRHEALAPARPPVMPGHRCRCLSLRFLIRLPQVAMSHQAPARLWERS